VTFWPILAFTRAIPPFHFGRVSSLLPRFRYLGRLFSIFSDALQCTHRRIECPNLNCSTQSILSNSFGIILLSRFIESTMRLLVPSATIVVLSGTGNHVVAAAHANTDDAANAILRSKFARDVEAAYKSDPMGQRHELQRKRSLERKEHSNFKSIATQKVDVGILTAAGGRETIENNTPIYPVFLHGLKRMGKEEKQRFLQSEEDEAPKTCPSGCPQEFCDCGFTQGEVKYCTKEMLSVCERGLVSRCVPAEEVQFYEALYCTFAECVESNGSYENCACEYYASYCTSYYDYEESFDKCVTAECCEKSPDGEKATCLPALQPTSTPTGTPTNSMPPTLSPSVRFHVCFVFETPYVALVFNSAQQRPTL